MYLAKFCLIVLGTGTNARRFKENFKMFDLKHFVFVQNKMI